MGTLVTTALAGSTGKIFGKLIGNTITNAVFGGKHLVSGQRLGSIHQQKIKYGESIPNVYGKMKIAGNIIWMSEVNEHVKTSKKRVKLQEEIHSEYLYTISLAIGLCEGKISSIGKIWADDVLISDLNNIRIYLGDDAQEPDPLLEALLKSEALSYKGLAYVMIQDFNISNFGNKVPTFTFEVSKNGIDENSPENLVESLIIIPGCGEFVYDTKIQYNKSDNGNTTAINQHHTPGIANSVVALDQIKNDLPNVQWISPVVSWFGTSLDAAECYIKPGVEYDNDDEPKWSVSDFTRNNAHLISKNNNQVNYGGTPSDESIVRYIEYIKDKGYKVMFYPMMFVDFDGKPWRGRITGSSDSIQKFFNGENGYNKFIIHYAQLVKDHVDAFLIGSEMQDLTRIQDKNGNFPAVDELVKLADKVREIVGDKVKISYAANWNEYHSANKIYYMDKLWASKNIDFIGIDAYFPLTEIKKSEYNIEKIIEGWDSVEGYDFYYDGDKKIPLDQKYALKNIEFWWKNQHINPDGKITEWKPQMKKIWFTEYGFPSVSCATNQPNVFFDAFSSESKYPKFSDGEVDILAQRSAIKATEMRWKNSEMVERKFLWTWDARPYPTWPQLSNIWSDGCNWEKGHWVNGKVGVVELKTIIQDICIKAGLSQDDIDVGKLNGIVEGLIVDSSQSAMQVIQSLQKVYQFDMFEAGGKIHFVSNNNEISEIKYDDILVNHSSLDAIDTGDVRGPISIELGDPGTLPSTISIDYITNDFNVKRYEKFLEETNNKKVFEFDLPIVISDENIRKVGNNVMQNELHSQNTYEFYIPIHFLFQNTKRNESEIIGIVPGDIIIIEYQRKKHEIKVTSIDIKENNSAKIIGNTFSEIYPIETSPSINYNNKNIDQIIPNTNIEIFKIPGKKAIGIAASGYNNKWFGCTLDFTLKANDIKLHTESVLITKQSVIGNIKSFSDHKNQFTIDRNSQFTVKLYNGQIFSISEEEMFITNRNLAMIGNEIVKFSKAILQPDGSYIISNLLRGLYGTSSDQYDRFILLDEETVTAINIDLPAKQFEYSFKTHLDKHLVRSTDKSQTVIVDLNNSDLISPVMVQKTQDIISWTPRVLSNELFDDHVKNSFYVKFTDSEGNILHQDYTYDFEYKIPESLGNERFIFSVAAFDKNDNTSDFTIFS